MRRLFLMQFIIHNDIVFSHKKAAFRFLTLPFVFGTVTVIMNCEL